MKTSFLRFKATKTDFKRIKDLLETPDDDEMRNRKNYIGIRAKNNVGRENLKTENIIKTSTSNRLEVVQNVDEIKFIQIVDICTENFVFSTRM